MAWSVCLHGLAMGFVLFGNLTSLDRGYNVCVLRSVTAGLPSVPGCLKCLCSAQSREGGNASGSLAPGSLSTGERRCTASPGTGGEQEVGGPYDVAAFTSSFSPVVWCQILNQAVVPAHLLFLRFVPTERSPATILKSP